MTFSYWLCILIGLFVSSVGCSDSRSIDVAKETTNDPAAETRVDAATETEIDADTGRRIDAFTKTRFEETLAAMKKSLSEHPTKQEKLDFAVTMIGVYYLGCGT
jgi:hypothetical protein